jgi:hypothetical protein
MLPEFNMVIDYRNGGNIDAYIAPEIGYVYKGTTLYAKPGFGITPDGPTDRNVGVEFGFRLAF